MKNKMKVTGLLLGGYLLGRTKKLKLALTVTAAASGSTVYKNREQLQEALGKLSESSPELKELQEKITGRLVDSGRGPSTAGVAKGVDTAGSKLKEQTDKLNVSIDGGSQQADSDDEAPAEDETPSDDDDEVPEEEPAAEASSTEESSSSGSKSLTLAKGETRAVREWAQANGVEVSSRGRISNDVVRAYRNATKRASNGTRKQSSSGSSTRKSTSSTSKQGAKK